jgi:prepilin-type N-terminal cleavage/methylation domain-containing protein
MSYQQIKKKTEGFTIIEVLIVLAIAGLIMLVVFLAVPALQRNSRNTQRKNDVQAALSSLQEAVNNGNGKLPTTVASGIANGKYALYDTGEFSGSTSNATAVTSVTPTSTGVIINNFSKCPDPVPATGAVTVNVGATKRNVTAIYQVETSTGFQNQCIDM